MGIMEYCLNMGPEPMIDIQLWGLKRWIVGAPVGLPDEVLAGKGSWVVFFRAALREL